MDGPTRCYLSESTVCPFRAARTRIGTQFLCLRAPNGTQWHGACVPRAGSAYMPCADLVRLLLHPLLRPGPASVPSGSATWSGSASSSCPTWSGYVSSSCPTWSGPANSPCLPWSDFCSMPCAALVRPWSHATLRPGQLRCQLVRRPGLGLLAFHGCPGLALLPLHVYPGPAPLTCRAPTWSDSTSMPPCDLVSFGAIASSDLVRPWSHAVRRPGQLRPQRLREQL